VPPSVSAAVAALLSATEPLSQTELAERAGIHERSLRRHSDVLQALDVLRETEDGALRLALPFRESEKGERILPSPVAAEHCRRATQDAAFEAAVTLIGLEEARSLARPDSPLGAPFSGPPVELATDIDRLCDARPEWAPWLRLAQRLAGAETQPADTVQFGAEPAQQPLSGAQPLAQTTTD
jgi:hypothetical protein